MPRYRSCKNCPAYRYKYLSDAPGKCALQYTFIEDNGSVKPTEECTKPHDLMEMRIFAKRRNISLPGAESTVSEEYYQMYKEMRDWKKAWCAGDSEKAAEYLSHIIDLAKAKK